MVSTDTNDSSAPAASVVDRRRLDTWALLFVLSTIVLATYLTGAYTVRTEWPTDGPGPYSYQGNGKPPDAKAAVITACAAVSLSFGAIEAIAHLSNSNALGNIFVGSILEYNMALVLAVLWALALPFIMDPNIHLAQTSVNRSGHYVNDYQVTVLNGNMYFFSWGSALCVFVILVDAIPSYVRKRRADGGSEEHTTPQGAIADNANAENFHIKWLLLMVASAVVIGESVRFEKEVCPIEADLNAGKPERYDYYDYGDDYGRDRPSYPRMTPVYSTCAKNEIGFYTGIISLAVAFVALVLISMLSCLGRDQLVAGFEVKRMKYFTALVAGFIVVVLSTICVGALTFYEGPATYASNQYFAAWAGFFISVSMPWDAVKKIMIVVGDNEAETQVAAVAPAPATFVGDDAEVAGRDTGSARAKTNVGVPTVPVAVVVGQM